MRAERAVCLGHRASKARPSTDQVFTAPVIQVPGIVSNKAAAIPAYVEEGAEQLHDPDS